LKTISEELKKVEKLEDQNNEEKVEEIAEDSEEMIDKDAETFTKIDEEIDAKTAAEPKEPQKKPADDLSLPLSLRVSKKLSELNKLKKPLFSGLKFFLGRETLRECLIFVIIASGGQVSWHGATAPFPESDPSINYYVMDRPIQIHQHFGREYVQPQWVFDSINERVLLPVQQYAPGAKLPDHLSPFVNDEHEGYTPKRREELLRIKAQKLGLELPAPEEKQEEADVENSEELETKYLQELEAELAGKKYSQVEHESKNSKKRKKKKEETTTTTTKTKDGELEDVDDHDLSGLLSTKRRRLYQRIQFTKNKKKRRYRKT